jgi:hypothetical protein
MNHQRFKFYKHSTEYYRSLYNTINELEELDVTPCYFNLLSITYHLVIILL